MDTALSELRHAESLTGVHIRRRVQATAAGTVSGWQFKFVQAARHFMAGPGAYPEPLSDIFTPFIISLRQACPLAFGLTKHLMPTPRGPAGGAGPNF